MGKGHLALLLAFMTTAAQAQSLDQASRKSMLSETDRTIWDVPTPILPGTVLETDPAGWSDKNGAFFRPFSHFLEGKIALTLPVGKQTRSTTITKKVDLAAILPFLKMFSVSFAHSRRITLTEMNADISQLDYPSVRDNLHFYDSNRVSDPKQEQAREDLFGSLRQNAKASGGKSENSHYWLVMKTWQPEQQKFTDLRGTAAALVAGCSGAPDTAGKTLQDTLNPPDNSAKPDQKGGTDQSKPQDKGATANATSPTDAAASKSDTKPSGSVQLSISDKPTATVSGAIGGATAKTDSKPGGASTTCQLGELSGVTASNIVYTADHPISSILIVPIFVDSRGLLYVPMPDQSDPILAPLVVRRSQ